MKDKRLVFDSITDQFDKWRARYSEELFDYIVKTCKMNEEKKVLEIGPGTGQATDFALLTGCDYTAIELGANNTAFMREKYGTFPNFRIINDDFETHEFPENEFDIVYSAATIQWIRQTLAYEKCYSILKSGGFLAMFRMGSDYKNKNPKLYEEIQQEYAEHYAVEIPYTCKFDYEIGEQFGFRYLGKTKFYGQRIYTADEYVEFIKTNADLITIKEECKEPFFGGVKDAVLRHGNQIVIDDTFVLDLYQKND